MFNVLSEWALKRQTPFTSVLWFSKSVVTFHYCWAWLEVSSSGSSDWLNMQFRPQRRSWMCFWSFLKHSWNLQNTSLWNWTCLCHFLLLKDFWRWGREESRTCCLSPEPLVLLMSWYLDQLFLELRPVALLPCANRKSLSAPCSCSTF